MVKVGRDGDRITLTAICDQTFGDDALAALAVAAAENAADFPDYDVDERIVGSADPLPVESVLTEGWLFWRAEPDGR